MLTSSTIGPPSGPLALSWKLQNQRGETKECAETSKQLLVAAALGAASDYISETGKYSDKAQAASRQLSYMATKYERKAAKAQSKMVTQPKRVRFVENIVLK